MYQSMIFVNDMVPFRVELVGLRAAGELDLNSVADNIVALAARNSDHRTAGSLGELPQFSLVNLVASTIAEAVYGVCPSLLLRRTSGKSDG